jgi:hypothetical protein
MHIGGGPNDATTKAPFIAALDAKVDAFERCYTQVETPGTRGTFGIDLLIPAEGGHPETSNVRTALSGDRFRSCMIAAFATAQFKPTKHGRTKLSYALRFEPRP